MNEKLTKSQKLLIINESEKIEKLSIVSNLFLLSKEIKLKKLKLELMEEDFDIVIVVVDSNLIEIEEQLIKIIKDKNKKTKVILYLEELSKVENILLYLNFDIDLIIPKEMKTELMIEKIKKLSKVVEEEKIAILKQKELILFKIEDSIVENSLLTKIINEKRRRNQFLNYLKDNKEENIEFIKKMPKIIDYDTNLSNLEMNTISGYSKENILEFSFNLKKIKQVFILNKELKPMGEVIGDFSELLKQIANENKELDKVSTKLCNFLRKDISNFIINIMIDGDINKFNYLTDSFASSIEQLRSIVYNEVIDNSEDDEFF